MGHVIWATPMPKRIEQQSVSTCWLAACQMLYQWKGLPVGDVEKKLRESTDERVDLELATGDYKPAQIAAKKAAGLKIYGPDSTSGGTPWEPDYAAAVISI